MKPQVTLLVLIALMGASTTDAVAQGTPIRLPNPALEVGRVPRPANTVGGEKRLQSMVSELTTIVTAQAQQIDALQKRIVAIEQETLKDRKLFQVNGNIVTGHIKALGQQSELTRSEIKAYRALYDAHTHQYLRPGLGWRNVPVLVPGGSAVSPKSDLASVVYSWTFNAIESSAPTLAKPK